MSVFTGNSLLSFSSRGNGGTANNQQKHRQNQQHQPQRKSQSALPLPGKAVDPIIPTGKTVDERLKSMQQNPLYADQDDRRLFNHVTREYQRAYPGEAQYDEFGKMKRPQPSIQPGQVRAFDPNGVLGKAKQPSLPGAMKTVTKMPNLAGQKTSSQMGLGAKYAIPAIDKLPKLDKSLIQPSKAPQQQFHDGHDDSGYVWAKRPELAKIATGQAPSYGPAADPDGDYSYLDVEQGVLTDQQLDSVRRNAHQLDQHAQAIEQQGRDLLPRMTNGKIQDFQSGIGHVDALEKNDPDAYKNLPFETIVLHQTYKHSLGNNPTPEDMQNAYESAMDMGALQYADDSVRSALMQAYHEGKAGLMFTDVDLKQIAKDTRIDAERGYAQSGTVQNIKAGTDIAVGIGSKFVPFAGQAVDTARGIGQARIQGNKEGWSDAEIAIAAGTNVALNLAGGKFGRSFTKAVGLAPMGKTAAKTAKNRGIGATIEYGNDRVYQEGAKNVNNHLRKSLNRKNRGNQSQ